VLIRLRMHGGDHRGGNHRSRGVAYKSENRRRGALRPHGWDERQRERGEAPECMHNFAPYP
jgi:hypothetical protein